MATVVEKKDPTAKFGTQVDQQIAEATSRIRFHDFAFGALVLASLVLVYATAMILLDKYLVLPEIARQAPLIGFLAVAAGTAYWTVLRPLRRRVNPLYAAVQVEKTIDDAKNSVVGYVEAQERADVHPTVRAAMSARAAQDVAEADVNRAVDHRSLIYAGAVAAIFFLVLIVLFFVFRPAQFGSLVSRTFAPFTSGAIASRTQLTLLEPAGGDVTITTGQPVTIKVQVGGQVPDPEGPDRVRVLIRHSTATENYEELPLEPGATSRDWQIRVPDYLVRNGFWYKVAGGDAVTPEYKVSVRTLPVFRSFELKYEYPAYVNRLPQTTTDQHITAYRGTKITLIGTTNREVKSGRLTFDPPGRPPVNATRVPDRADSLQFEFLVESEGSYRLSFTSVEGESHTTPLFGIKIDPDFAPTVEIAKPEDDEILLPANGQLAVDGSAGDDLGLDRLTLKMKVVVPADRPLADKPYEGGKSFRRETDGTWPKSLAYKDSVDLTQLRDPAGQMVELSDGMILEYWLEAADNRTKPGSNGPEPDPNIGKSEVKRVRITPPAQEERKDKLDQQKQERQAEEKQHRQDQQQKLDQEERKPQPLPNAQPQPQEDQPEPKTGEQEKKDGAPKDGAPKDGAPKDGAPKGMEGTPQDMNNTGGTNKTESAPMPRDANTRDLENQANRIQQSLDQKQNDGGSGKPNPGANPEDQVPPSEQKPKPMGGMEPPPESPPKEGPKPDMGMPGGSSAETKPEPGEQPPQDPTAQKPEPKNGASPMDPMGGMSPSDTKPGPQQDQPMAGGTGQEKPAPQPKEPGATPPMPENQPNSTQDPSGGGMGKPASQQEPKDPGTGAQPQPKAPGDSAAKPKPMPANDPGTDREPPATQPESQPQDGGTAKPRTAPQPSAAKPGPKDGDPMSKPGSTSEQKPAPTDGPMSDPRAGKPSPGETKPDATNPMGGMESTARAEDKPTPADQKKSAGNNTAGGGSEKKLTPEQRKEIENAFKDLADPSASKEQKEQARQKLDNSIGSQNRKDAEQLMNNLQSDDPNKRAEAQKKLDNLKMEAEKQAAKTGGEPKGTDQKLTPEQQKEAENALNELNDPKATPQEKEQARQTLDKTVGKENRQEAEQLLNDLKSDDANKRAAAEKKLQDMKNQMAKSGGEPKTGEQPKMTPEQQKEVANAMKDLADPKASPEQKKQARETLDKTVGPENRKKAEEIANGLNSKDPKEQEAARQQLEDMKNQMAKGRGEPKQGTEPKDGGGKEPKATAQQKVDPKEVEQALQDLNSPDQKTREAAKQKLDDALGKGAGKEAEDATNQANSDKFEEQGMGRKKLDELRNRAEQMAKGGKPQPGQGKTPSKDEIENLAKRAEDLNSKDDAKRKAAEEEFDEKIGKENRQKLQEGMKDPQKAEELRKEIEEMAKSNPGSGGEQADGNLTPMGTSQQATKIPEQMKEDARNRAKSAALQLETFEKNKDNKELLKDLGMTQDEYDEFLKGYREHAARLKQHAEALESETPPPPGPPATAANVSGGGKVEHRPNTGTGTAGVGGPAFAAPGFQDALERFQFGAARMPVKKP